MIVKENVKYSEHASNTNIRGNSHIELIIYAVSLFIRSEVSGLNITIRIKGRKNKK